MTNRKNQPPIGKGAGVSKKPLHAICVFCGSSSAADPHYTALAARTGTALANGGFKLVYGGGGVGLMGAAAKAAHAAGGDVLGIIPEFLQTKEVLYTDVPHHIVPDMHTRKQMMYDAADGFLVLPGGIGTLEEAVEIISWLRMGLHAKPVVFLDEDEYWTPLMTLLHHTISARFSPVWMAEHLHRATDPERAIKLMKTAAERLAAHPDEKTPSSIDKVV